MEEEEYFFTCPYCWSSISMLLDLSVKSQSYTEDCEVCCQPIEIFYDVVEGQIRVFEARGTQ